MKDNFCEGCFAYQPYCKTSPCRILVTKCPPNGKCSFRKTELQFEQDALNAAIRLQKKSPSVNTEEMIYRCKQKIKKLTANTG